MGVDTAQRLPHPTRQRVSSGDNQSGHSRVPSETELTSLFDAAMKRSAAMDEASGGSRAAAMTPDEQQKFLKAMQDEEFRTLLNDYMQEISDPSNRAETEQYLAQLEREQKVPSDKLLIKPTPGFVIKTKWLSSQKIFVNICSSDKLQPPSSTKVAHKGTSWSLPYSVGPERLEKDKSGGSVTTFDVCFHPRTLQFATLQKPYRDMVATTCVDAIEPLLRKAQKKPDGELSRDYRVLKGVLYKSGEPVTMCLTKPKETVETVEEASKKETEIETLTPPRIVEDVKQPAKSRHNSVDIMKPEDTKPFIQEVSSTKLTTEPAVVRALPKLVFRVIYRGRFEMMDHMQATLQVDPKQPVERANRPKELVVEIEFPTFSSAKGIDLDVNDSAVQVKAEGYEPLEIKLPFAVVEAKGSAKFDKKARKLVVTLPVQPPAPVEVKRMAIEEHDDEDEEEQQTEEEEPTVETVRNPREDEHVKTAAEPEKKLDAGQHVSRPPPTEQEELFARLRETAMMVTNDPMYLPQPAKDEKPQPQAETKLTASASPVATEKPTLEETVKQLVANDTTYDDLPPLESCSEDEDEEDSDDVQGNASSKPAVPVVESSPVPQTPLFTVKETMLCRSYLVDVGGVEAKSVELSFPFSYGFVLRFVSPTGAYELRVDDLANEIDTNRSEFHVASENLVVILYKKTDVVEATSLLAPPPPVVRFQNDLLYELD